MVGLLVSLRPGAAGGAGGGPGGAAQGAGSAGGGIRRPWGAVEGRLSAVGRVSTEGEEGSIRAGLGRGALAAPWRSASAVLRVTHFFPPRREEDSMRGF